ncbi:thermonuclease family protein [Pseudomonas luteola]
MAIGSATEAAFDAAKDKANSLINAETIEGKAVRVLDGDTIDVLKDGKLVRIRFDSMDAPEKSQPFGQRSKQTLTDWIGNQMVKVDVKAEDRYGRKIGVIYLNGVNINRAMVQKGMAFAYEQYLHDDQMLALQAQAKGQKLGVWSQPENQIVKPWDYRKANKH